MCIRDRGTTTGMISQPAPEAGREDACNLEQRHQYGDLECGKSQGFKIKTPEWSEGADETEVSEIEAGETPVGKTLHVGVFFRKNQPRKLANTTAERLIFWG